MDIEPNPTNSPPPPQEAAHFAHHYCTATAPSFSSSSSIVPSSSSSSPSPSRYESQKRHNWNTFNQYLKNHRPPLSLARCSGAHVLEFLCYLDQFGKTKVHVGVCPFLDQFGKTRDELGRQRGELGRELGRWEGNVAERTGRTGHAHRKGVTPFQRA